MWCEGYTADYKRRFGNPGRTVILKSGVIVGLDNLKDYFHDELAVSAILFYQRWTISGYPWRDWGDIPNRLVQIVEMLWPLDRLYHPEIRL